MFARKRGAENVVPRCQPIFPEFSWSKVCFSWLFVVCRNDASNDLGDFHGNHSWEIRVTSKKCWYSKQASTQIEPTHPDSHSPRLGAKQAFLDVVGKGGNFSPRTFSTSTIDLVASMHQTVPWVPFLSNFDDVMFGGGLFCGLHRFLRGVTGPWGPPSLEVEFGDCSSPTMRVATVPGVFGQASSCLWIEWHNFRRGVWRLAFGASQKMGANSPTTCPHNRGFLGWMQLRNDW